MIEYLRGRIFHKSMPQIILDVNGVGYGVELTSAGFAELPADGGEVGLWVFTRVKEDVLKLYGFLHRDERKVFDILLNVNGVGPKIALAILSTMSVGQLRESVENRDSSFLEGVPGIGKRTAEKIVVELQNKVDKFPVSVGGGHRNLDGAFESQGAEVSRDLFSALENLGFKRKEIQPVVERVLAGGGGFQDMMRRSLALLKPKSTADLDQLF